MTSYRNAFTENRRQARASRRGMEAMLPSTLTPPDRPSREAGEGEILWGHV